MFKEATSVVCSLYYYNGTLCRVIATPSAHGKLGYHILDEVNER